MRRTISLTTSHNYRIEGYLYCVMGILARNTRVLTDSGRTFEGSSETIGRLVQEKLDVLAAVSRVHR